MSDASTDPVEEPPTVIGVPPETPAPVRPSATGLVVDPSAEEDEAAVEAGKEITRDAAAKGGDGSSS
jgi:hypothetical protein